MAKAKNSFEEMATAAAKRLRKVHDAGQQLTFLPDETGSAVDVVENRPVGRPAGAKGKVNNQMREWLASKGYAMPEDVLAQMAGLASGGDAMLTAMERTEMLLAWSFDGATEKVKGGGTKPAQPSGGLRLATFMQLYTIQLRAADALLPYGAQKAAPDVVHQTAVQIITPAPREDPRDVTPKPAKMRSRMVPADVVWKNEQKQDVSDSSDEQSDGESRTERLTP